AGSMELTGIDQLWIADITYIRLETEFVYLAVVLDAYSRKVIGWELDSHLEDDLALAALKMALRRRKPPAGLTHHSDRGVQYASDDYTDLLKDNGIDISMSRKARNTKKSIDRNTAIWPTPAPRSSTSSKRSITASVCIR